METAYQAINSLQQKIARQCAPVILGIKPANLLTIDRDMARQFVQLLQATDLEARFFHGSGQRQIWFLFRRDALEEVLEDEEKRNFLKEYGYEPEEGLEPLLSLMVRRFRFYKKGEIGFPHELGIFLGYPLGDVKGFIENEGKNCLFIGYWKVYENEDQARHTFHLYDFAKNFVLNLVQHGVDLEMVCRI